MQIVIGAIGILAIAILGYLSWVSNPETFAGSPPAYLLLLSGSFLLFCIALPLS